MGGPLRKYESRGYRTRDDLWKGGYKPTRSKGAARTVSLAVPPDLMKKLQEQKDRKAMSMSAVIRHYLRIGLKIEGERRQWRASLLAKQLNLIPAYRERPKVTFVVDD